MLKTVGDRYLAHSVVFLAHRSYSHQATGRPEEVAVRYEPPAIERRVKVAPVISGNQAAVSRPAGLPTMPTWAPHDANSAPGEREAE